jgi:hypothetical protein
MQGRITDRAQESYDLFCHTLCKGQVKIIMVVTGLEGGGIDPTNPASVKDWLSRNKPSFTRNGMEFFKIDCLTAILGKKLENDTYLYQEAYTASKKGLEKLILKQCAKTPKDIDWSDDQSTLSWLLERLGCSW